MADTYKFRIDHHGSLVRPPELLAARERRAAGTLDDDGLRAVEDSCIAEAVRAQRRLGLSVVTDGEFRRVEHRDIVLDDRLVADAVAIAAQTLVPAKVTLPSPAYLIATGFDGLGLAEAIRERIESLIGKGVRYVQLTNPGYAAHLFGTGGPLSLSDAIALDRAALPDSRPADVRIGLCPTTHTTPELDGSAAARLFAELPVDRWILPYHTGSDAELALLRAVPADRDACLGIVDPATPELEDVEAIMRRMDAAAEYKDIDDLAVSPAGGFSDVAGQAAIGAEDQRRKLVHVETIARMCWGNEL